jgi:hypothetical protein
MPKKQVPGKSQSWYPRTHSADSVGNPGLYPPCNVGRRKTGEMGDYARQLSVPQIGCNRSVQQARMAAAHVMCDMSARRQRHRRRSRRLSGSPRWNLPKPASPRWAAAPGDRAAVVSLLGRRLADADRRLRDARGRSRTHR